MNAHNFIPIIIEHVQKHGKVHPMVYIELDNAEIQVVPLFNFRGDSATKTMILFHAGRTMGQKLIQHELQESCFITESWVAVTSSEASTLQCQSAPAPQLEAIMVTSAKNRPPYEALVSAYQMKRDKSHRVSELVLLTENTVLHGSMGIAFLAGWHSRHLTNAEVRLKQPQGIHTFLRALRHERRGL